MPAFLYNIFRKCGGRLRTTPEGTGCVWFPFLFCKDKSEALYTLFEIAKYYAKGRPRYVVTVILRFESPLDIPSVRPRGP